MTLILKYERKDFFGNSKYEEDKISHFAKNDLIKSFLFFLNIEMQLFKSIIL